MKYLFVTLAAIFFTGCSVNSYGLEKPRQNYEVITAKSLDKPQYKKLTHKQLIGLQEYGIASYYGPAWNGRRTANGERLNLSALTAAHKSLPFNTLVRVTDLDTGKSIVVRVNDRGPYVKGRIIDLTDAAAAKLGILRKGIARVKLEVIG